MCRKFEREIQVILLMHTQSENSACFSLDPLYSQLGLQERWLWTTAAARSSRKQTLASERGWSAWYNTQTKTVLRQCMHVE